LNKMKLGSINNLCSNVWDVQNLNMVSYFLYFLKLS